MSQSDFAADPLVWGTGPRVFEMFLEPTCPFSAKAFAKIDDLLNHAGEDNIQVCVWLHSQPWHMLSSINCRAILAASTLPEGKEAARKLMAAIYSDRMAYEFEDHRTGPNTDISANQLIARMEEASGLSLAEAFQNPNLTQLVKNHTRYARQNGIHVSPTCMVDGLIDGSISSGDSAEEWAAKILG